MIAIITGVLLVLALSAVICAEIMIEVAEREQEEKENRYEV